MDSGADQGHRDLTEITAPDVRAIADAILLLANLRLRYAAEIPLGIWRMMVSAEKRLNTELEAYFRPGDSDSIGRSVDHRVESSTPEPQRRSPHAA